MIKMRIIKDRTGNNRFSFSLVVLCLLFSILFLSLFLVLVSKNVSAFSTDKSTYLSGEKISIFLSDNELVGSELKIQGPSGSFKYLGELKSNLSFNMALEGDYVISLDSPQLGHSELDIQVISKPVVCNFSLNKQVYSLGEDVAISLSGCNVQELLVTHDLKTLKNIRPVNFELFTPNETGDYLVTIVLLNDTLKKTFSVVPVINQSSSSGSSGSDSSSGILGSSLISVQNSSSDSFSDSYLNSSDNTGETYIPRDKLVREQAKKKEESLMIQDSLKKSYVSVSGEGKTYLQLGVQGVRQVSESNLRLNMGLTQPTYISQRIKSAEIKNVLGAKEDFHLNVLNKGTDLEINWDKAVQPGIYKVIFTKEDGTITETYLAVGLISVNSVKPIYKVGEQADLLMVVLDKYGYLVTNANVDLEIITPDNKKIQRTTVDNSIVETTKRGVYETTFVPNKEGTYYLIASTTVDGINVNVTSSFLVKNDYEFDILRSVPATIDPWEGPYKNEFTIIPSLELMNTSYSFSELIPNSFGLINFVGVDNVYTSNDTTMLTWNNLSGISKLNYEAQVPLISPYLYELGEAKITYVDDSGLNKTFYEARPWLFAIDPAAVTCTESPCVASSSLLQCTGASGEPNAPNAIDTCTDGTSGTCHSDESVENITVTNLDARPGDNSFRIGDTIEIEVWYYCWGATEDNTQIAYYNGSAWVNLFNTQCGTTGYTSKTTQVVLDNYIGTQTIRGIITYNSASATTCASGNYDDDDDVSFVVKTDDDQGPVISNTEVNDTSIAINDSVRITSSINDLMANVDAALVEVLYSNGTKNNFSMSTITISDVFTNDFNTTTNSILGQSGIPATTTYNYQGVTTSSAENAWFNDVDRFLYGGSTARRNTHVEFTNTQYSEIASSDDSRATSVDPGRNDEIVADFQFFIQEPIANINTIQFTTESSTTVSTTYNREIYLLQAGAAYQTDSNWLNLGSCSGTGNIDITCSKNLTSSFSTYIDETTGQLDWSGYMSVSSEINYYDYVEAKVFYTTSADNEADKPWITQNQITNDSWTNISYVNITITVDSYSNSGSSSRSNNNPDIQLQLYNGSSWLDLGTFSISGSGDYTLSTTNSALLSAWEDPNNRDVRIRGVNYDYVSGAVYDNITYSNLKVTVEADKELYYYDFTNTQNSGLYNVTKVWANDTWGNINYQNYTNVYFNVYNYGVPKITINSIGGDTSETYAFQDQTPDINATIDTNASCYLSLLDESYDDMVSNGRINCGNYEQNIPKICTYSSTLNVGSQTIYMACKNTLPGAPSTSKHSSSDNSESNIDVLCDTHLDCSNNQFCDYTYHCHSDIVDGFDCKAVSYDNSPDNDVCGSFERGGTDYGTCVNDSSYFFTGWYCAHDTNDCVYNDSGNTYDLNYALCDLSVEGYRVCGYSSSQEWSSLFECGAQFDGTNNSANASTHIGYNCSYFSSVPNCLSGDLDLGDYGCNATITDCGSYVYLGSGLCGSTLADCDQGCGAECDSDTNVTAGLGFGSNSGICYYDKSCSNSCSYSESTEEAPSYCINDNDGGVCSYNNRTNPSSQETCYWNVSCSDGTGASLDNSGLLRADYCDYCTALGNVSGAYSPIPNSTCLSNCSNSGIIYYDPQGTPADRSDDCDGLGNSNLLTDTLTMGDVWIGSGQAYCDDTECNLDCGLYLDGACSGGSSGTCVCTDNNNPEITIYNPGDGFWFNSLPAEFEFEVNDLGSGIENCSLAVDGSIVSTNNSILENTITNISFTPSLGSFTWQIECYDNSTSNNYNISDFRNSGYDNTQPAITNADINQTSFEINEYVCINATLSDTYSGLDKVYAEIELPDNYGKINVTLTDSAKSCDSGTNNGVYSVEYQLIFSGPFNLTNIYGIDKATNVGNYPVSGKNWSVAAAGFLESTMLEPQNNLLINESESNYYFNQTCKARCTDKGINCEQVAIGIQYYNDSSSSWLEMNTTSNYLLSDQDNYDCGNLTISEPDWWNTNYSYRRRLNISLTGVLEQGYTVSFTLDTTSADMQSDGDDLRIVYYDGQSWTELDRINNSPFNSATTEISFRTQDQIISESYDYYVYYGNSLATNPPSNPENVYFFYDDFEDGNIDGWNNFSSGVVSYTTASGYGGVITKTTNNDPNGGYRVFSRNITSYEVWFDWMRPNEDGGAQTRYSITDSNAAGYGFRQTDVNPSKTFAIEERSSGGSSAGNIASKSTSWASLNTWYRVKQIYDSNNINITVYDSSGSSELDSLSATDNSVTSFDRFVINGGYEFYTDNIKLKLYKTTPPTVTLEAEKNQSFISDQPGTSCEYTFNISSSGEHAGNTSWSVRCKAYADNAPTTFSNSYNVTINDHPLSIIIFPTNNTWVSGTFNIDGSSSTDNDGTISNYLFRYDNNSLFSSPTTVCNGGSTTCSWNSLNQDQCVNNSISCYLGLRVTDNDGLTSDAYVVVGIDTNGPVNTLLTPENFANYSYNSGSLILASASIIDNEVGNVDEVLFQYRINSTDTWKSACNDTDGGPYQCNWNISSLSDGLFYEFRVYANDSFGNIGGSDIHTNITIDRNGPIVLLEDPVNNTYGIENFTITYNVSDALLGVGSNAISNCSIYVDSTLEKTNHSITQLQNSFVISISGEGSHPYYVECYDKLGNLGISNTKNIIIDSSGPVTTILQPLTSAQISGTSYMLNASVVDAGVGTISYVQFEYRQNPNDVWKNACNDSDGSAPFNCSWDISLLADGSSYQVRARANDTLGNLGLYDTEVNIKIDNNPPEITILSPKNNYVDTDGNVTFSYQVNDQASSISNCSLIYNGTINQTHYSPQENTPLSFIISGLNDSVVNWSIECYDTFSTPHYSSSVNRTLTIDIKFILNVFSNTTKLDYEYGDQAGENATILINTTDLYNFSLSANTITDIIVSSEQPLVTWWNTSWNKRKLLRVYEPGVHDRENWPVKINVTLSNTASCDELRVIDADGNLVNFTVVSTTYNGGKCTNAEIVFLATVLYANYSDYYVYYNNTGASSVAVTPATYCTAQTPSCWTTQYSRVNLAHTIESWQSSATLISNNNDDDTSYTRTLPWNFPLFDRTPSSTMYIWTNGFLSPTISGTSGWYQNLLTGGSSLASTPMIAPLWDDLYVNTNAGIWETINNSGAVSKVIYTFNLTTYAQRTSNLKDFFQAVLYETGDVIFNYGLFTVGGETPTTGISKGTNSDYLSNDDTWGSNAESVFYQRVGTNVTQGAEQKFITRFTGSTNINGEETLKWNVFNQNIGLYYAVTKASKTKYNDDYDASFFNISYDSKSPVINLVSPDNTTEADSSVTFAYKVNDALSSVSNCTLLVDGIPGESDDTIQEGLSQFFYPRIPGVGPHNWSVSCVDAYGNVGFSDEWIIIIKPPELHTNKGNLSITPGPYKEQMNLSINLTIWNNGGSDTVNNFTVNVYDGNISNGVFLTNFSLNLTDQFGNHQYDNISFYYLINKPGKTQLYVEIDAPVSSNGTILELNESNNVYEINISVPGYTEFFGNITSNILLSTVDNNTIFNITGVTKNSGLVYFADSDNNIQFNSLQALGKKSDNTSSSNDFVELDNALNMSAFNDSINNVWTLGTGNPINTTNLVVMGRSLHEVPVINSGVNWDFKTGILWDASGDASNNSEYDFVDKEGILFVTNINDSSLGNYGVYDYQAKIPAKLRDYAGSGGKKIALYYELY